MDATREDLAEAMRELNSKVKFLSISTAYDANAADESFVTSVAFMIDAANEDLAVAMRESSSAAKRDNAADKSFTTLAAVETNEAAIRETWADAIIPSMAGIGSNDGISLASSVAYDVNAADESFATSVAIETIEATMRDAWADAIIPRMAGTVSNAGDSWASSVT